AVGKTSTPANDTRAARPELADPAGSPNPDDYATIEPASWRQVDLLMDAARGGTCSITLLRPLPWVELMGAKAGERIQLTLPEMGVYGKALVKSVGPCPPIKPESTAKDRKSDVVIGTFRTTNAVVMDLYVEGLDKPIGTTASHPFYSVDRGGWTAAGDLKPGETLRTQSGTTKVVRSATKPGTQTVYNLEVHRSHTYFVSDAKLLVHNTCPLERGSTGRTIPKNLNERLAMEEVMANPLGRRVPLTKGMTDPRWPQADGWVKMRQNVNDIEIHWVERQTPSGPQFDDFKFK
ncbi:MAG: polymorphic toxin-type HINT domain-containing protein, partial [Phycisphaerales bacterium]